MGKTVDRSKYLHTYHLITPQGQQSLIDQTETPEGFKAVPKDLVVSKILNDNTNVCSFCDWRKTCQVNSSVPCMSYARKDGIGVVFKKKD